MAAGIRLCPGTPSTWRRRLPTGIYIVPDVETMKTLGWGWALWLYAVNAAGDLRHVWLDRALLLRQAQARHALQIQRQVSGGPSVRCILVQEPEHRQLPAQLLRSRIPLWTVVEVYAVVLRQWLCAVAHLGGHPVYLALLVFIAPIIHEVHFFLIHRAIHWPPLYNWVHSVHHNSINPSPWSSLSMHPVEGFLYHAVAFWHLVIPSNPDRRALPAARRRLWRGQRPYRLRQARNHRRDRAR